MTPPESPLRDRLCLLALGLVALPLFTAPLLDGAVLHRRDLGLVWVAQVDAFVNVVASGSLPLWNPWGGLGQPMLADPRYQAAYPPQWLNLLMRPGTFLTWSVVAHLWLAGAGLFVWMRRRGLSRAAAMTAAVGWQASGPLLSFVNFGGHHFASAAWMSWALGETDRVLEQPTPRAAARLAAVLALQVLAGSPDVVMFTALGGVALVLARPSRRALSALAGAAALGTALSAVQWAPTLELVARTGRGRITTAEQVEWSVAPLRMVEVVLPVWWNGFRLQPWIEQAALDGTEPFVLSLYLGAPLLALAVVGLASREKRLSRALGATAAVALLFALGPHTPVHPILASTTPLHFLRYPSKSTILVALVCSALAGLGLDHLRRAPTRRLLAAAGALLAVAVGLRVVLAAVDRWGPSLLLPGGWPEQSAAAIAALDPTLVALLAAGVAGFFVPRPAAVAVLGIAAAGDLLVRHAELNAAAPAALYATRPRVLGSLPAGSRVWVEDYSVGPAAAPPPYELARTPAGWPPPAAVALGLQEYLHPPLPMRWRVRSSFDHDLIGFLPSGERLLGDRLRRAAGAERLRLLQLAGVDSVLALRALASPDLLVPVTEIPGFFREPVRVLRVPDPLARVSLVTGAVERPTDEAALETLLTPGFDARGTVVVAPGHALPSRPGSGGDARVTAERADRLEVQVQATQEALLLVLQAWDPGWRAEVDGREVPVTKANVAFSAVRVRAGAHHVSMRYRPRAATAGAIASLVGLVVLVVAASRRPVAAGGEA